MNQKNNLEDHMSEPSLAQNSFVAVFRSALLNARVNAVNLQKMEFPVDEKELLASPKIVVGIQQDAALTEDYDILFGLISPSVTTGYRLLARLSVAWDMDFAALVKTINLVLTEEQNDGIKLVLPPTHRTDHHRLATNFIPVS